MRSRLSPVEQREALAALRRAYERELPAKVEAIARALPGPQADDPDAACLDDLYHLAHRLAGSAAIYGFDDVRHAAAALESLVMSAIEGRIPRSARLREELTAVVARLRQSLPAPSPDLDKRH
jgi:chemotaxis protein histidine kinase CheA